MDTGTRGFSRGDIRVSDAERDQALAELSEHFQAGRLTQDEFDDRSGSALRGRTGADLDKLFTDLPLTHLSPGRAVIPPQPPFASPDPVFTPGGPARPDLLSLGRVILAFVVAAIVAGGLLGRHGHYHGGIGWLVPVLIVGLIFVRMAFRRR